MYADREMNQDPPSRDAYLRASNPERFRPFVDHVVDQLDQLARTYDVARSEQFEILSADEIQPFTAARTPVSLVPASVGSAPLAVAFTTFPGVVLRCGYWRTEWFPQCGCDACHETAETEVARFTRIVDAVVGGRFHESANWPLFGRAVVHHQYEHADGGSSGGARYLSRASARQLLRGRPRAVDWSAWQAR